MFSVWPWEDPRHSQHGEKTEGWTSFAYHDMNPDIADKLKPPDNNDISNV